MRFCTNDQCRDWLQVVICESLFGFLRSCESLKTKIKMNQCHMNKLGKATDKGLKGVECTLCLTASGVAGLKCYHVTHWVLPKTKPEWRLTQLASIHKTSPHPITQGSMQISPLLHTVLPAFSYTTDPFHQCQWRPYSKSIFSFSTVFRMEMRCEFTSRTS